MLLKDKVALITGASRGMGAAIAREFLRNGATVVVCGSREESALKAVEELKKEDESFKVYGKWPDLSSPEEVSKTVEEVVKEFGKLDIMVNNAGVSEKTPTLEVDPNLFKKVIDLNVNSVFYGCQAAARVMKEQGQGVIINTSSMVSKNGQPSGVAYPASKFAVNGLTISLARELGQYGIRVNAVAPGVMNTDMVKSLPEAMIQPLVQAIPMKRMGEPVDVAMVCVFLASDLASYVSGDIIHVDGGMTV